MIKLMIKTIIIVIIVTIIAGSAYFYFNQDKDQIFTDQENGYQFTYADQTWQVASKEDLAKLNGPKAEGELKVKNALIHQDQSLTMFSQIIQNAKGAKTFNRDRSIEQMEKDNQNRHNSYKKLNVEKNEFLGYPAINYEFEYGVIIQARANEMQLRERQIIFLANEKIYRLIFSAEREDYRANQANFDKIIKSFKLI